MGDLKYYHNHRLFTILSIKKAKGNNKQHTPALAPTFVLSENLPLVTIGFTAIFGPLIAKRMNLSFEGWLRDMFKASQVMPLQKILSTTPMSHLADH